MLRKRMADGWGAKGGWIMIMVIGGNINDEDDLDDQHVMMIIIIFMVILSEGRKDVLWVWSRWCWSDADVNQGDDHHNCPEWGGRRWLDQEDEDGEWWWMMMVSHCYVSSTNDDDNDDIIIIIIIIIRDVTIRVWCDTIRIAIQVSREDTYHDTYIILYYMKYRIVLSRFL